jgi:lysozyme
MTKEGIDLIKSFESCRLKAYDDGVGVMTIGWGTTKGVKRGMVITQEEADRLFEDELDDFADGVETLVTADINNNQFSALVSLAYNIGLRAFGRSTLLKKVNSRAFAAAADQFLAWNKGGGKVMRGLTRRREAERKLFLKPDHSPLALVAAADSSDPKNTNNKTDEQLSSPTLPPPEQPTQTVETQATGTQINVAPNALADNAPIVSKPGDEPIEVTHVAPQGSGAKKSIWATIAAGVTYLAINIKELFTTGYESVKDNPMLAVSIICGSVLIIVVYWKYQDRQTKLDEQRQRQAHELTLEQMRMASDPRRYSVSVVQEKTAVTSTNEVKPNAMQTKLERIDNRP